MEWPRTEAKALLFIAVFASVQTTHNNSEFHMGTNSTATQMAIDPR